MLSYDIHFTFALSYKVRGPVYSVELAVGVVPSVVQYVLKQPLELSVQKALTIKEAPVVTPPFGESVVLVPPPSQIMESVSSSVHRPVEAPSLYLNFALILRAWLLQAGPWILK